MQPNYFLENNRTPATHFIELWKSCNNNVIYQIDNVVPIIHLWGTLRTTYRCGHKTVAIFKIHPKCKN